MWLENGHLVIRMCVIWVAVPPTSVSLGQQHVAIGKGSEWWCDWIPWTRPFHLPIETVAFCSPVAPSVPVLSSESTSSKSVYSFHSLHSLYILHAIPPTLACPTLSIHSLFFSCLENCTQTIHSTITITIISRPPTTNRYYTNHLSFVC